MNGKGGKKRRHAERERGCEENVSGNTWKGEAKKWYTTVTPVLEFKGTTQ